MLSLMKDLVREDRRFIIYSLSEKEYQADRIAAAMKPEKDLDMWRAQVANIHGLKCPVCFSMGVRVKDDLAACVECGHHDKKSKFQPKESKNATQSNAKAGSRRSGRGRHRGDGTRPGEAR